MVEARWSLGCVFRKPNLLDVARILCVDDEVAALEILREMLERAGHQPITVQNAEAALNVLSRGGIDLLVSDYRMPGVTGLELLERIRESGLDVPVIMITGYGSIEHAVLSIKAGAVDYVTKPIRPQQLELAVEQALELTRLRRENAALRDEVAQLQTGRQILGESPALRRVLETISAVAPTRAAVLLQGESGTGKELLARAIHALSDRRDGPFVSVNCAALPESLVESMLFGHEKGAFTGALKQTRGAFERANRGTLLLDEVSEMRFDLQAKLLRVLQEQEFERVGGTVPIRVDVRIIATTNRNLLEEVRQGRFREDLYYRLNTVPVLVPPLRERVEDIPILAQHFARLTAKEIGKTIAPLPAETIALLQAHDWPGNIRELAHVVERAVILAPGPVIGPEMFDPSRFGLAAPGYAARVASSPAGLVDERGGPGADGDPGVCIVLRSFDLAAAERLLIDRALEAARGNRTRAAHLLGMSVRTLRHKLNQAAGARGRAPSARGGRQTSPVRAAESAGERGAAGEASELRGASDARGQDGVAIR
jgi:DNA-binding NtrC family response regulator